MGERVMLRYGDVLRWTGGGHDDRLIMFVRWAIPSDRYPQEHMAVAVDLSNLAYPIDSGFPAGDETTRGSSEWSAQWEKIG